MKKLFITTLFLAAVCAFAATPHIKTTEKTLKDGRKLSDRFVHMNNGYFRLLQTTADGKNAVKKNWGEYFFGFEFGRLPRTNGSWSVWEFFSPWEYISEKGKKTVLNSRPWLTFLNWSQSTPLTALLSQILFSPHTAAANSKCA
jgi:hypothetical protein